MRGGSATATAVARLRTSDDGGITHARLERPARNPYGRVEVVDLQGRKAWTNPLWI